MPLSTSLTRTTRPTLGGVLALFLFMWMAQVPVQAQRLGGLPDLAFHPKDSGLAVPQLNRKNQIFLPGPKGGLFMSLYNNPRIYYQRGRHCQQYVSYYAADGSSNYYNTYSYYSEAQGHLMPVQPGRYYMAQEGRGGYQQITDSIRIIPYNIGNTNYNQARPSLIAPFYFYHPFQGFPSMGVAKASDARLVFFLTHNPNDTAGVHTQTYLRLLDTSGMALPVTNTLTSFRAELASERNGLIYLLGRQMIDTVPGNTIIRVVNGLTLAEVPIGFAGPAPQFLSASKPKVFKVLPDGKFLVAGYLWHEPFGTYVDMAQRLMPDGTPDPTWATTFLGGEQATAWYLDSAGTLRGANVSIPGQATLAVVLPNGRYTPTRVAIDPSYPSPRALTYQPEQNAFLFETGDLSPTLQANQWGSPVDTIYGTRHRFYVGFNGETRPLINHYSAGMYSDYFSFTSRESLGKLVLSGDFTQIDKKLMPVLAVVNADGTLDTTFQPVYKMEEPLRSQLLAWNYPSARLTPTGRVLLSYSGSGYTGLSFLDSTQRLLPNGSVDHTYTPIWGQGTLIPNKRNGYTTIRTYVQGSPVHMFSEQLDTEIRLVELDAEGNFMREYGSFTPDGSYPDTNIASASRRWRYAFAEDDQGGFWAANSWQVDDFTVTPPTYHYRNYYIRYDLTTGRPRVMAPNFTILGAPLKIEILAGKRMRLTGCFNLPNDTLLGSYFNIIETDSLCRLDPAVAPIRYYIPDSYGTRGPVPLLLRKVLPDGKILGDLQASPGTRLIVRYFPDGRQDPSFLPITMGLVQTDNLEVMNDRLYLGGENYNWLRMRNRAAAPYLYGGSKKNGLHSYKISSVPGTVGFVQGRVQQVVSPATGCAPTGTRRPATGMILRAEPTGRIAVADTGGYYFMALDTGRHEVSQSIRNNFLERQVCPPATGAQASPPRQLHLAQAGTTLVGQDFINQTFDCPRLAVNVLQPRFRLCSRSAIRLQYQNDGMADEPSARIRLNLPTEIRVEGSSHAFTRGDDSSYVFDLGRLAPGAHGEVVLRDTILCPATPDSMARACYAARIEPLSLCSRIDPNTLAWDGAWLDASAQYIPLRDIVRVVVRNRGAAMADSTPMTLLSTRTATYFKGKISLDAGDSLVYELPPAIQGSISLSLKQTPNCPLGSRSSLWHSGRGTARAFLNFGEGLLESYTVHACPSFRFSYDPNEKTVEPQGAIEPGTELSYTIHFENFGNDTAYSVIVEDSLPAGLDATTLKITGSSHPCNLELTGTDAQPVAYFHFKPIKLTGKREDSVRSKGQVDFTIRTREDVLRGSVVSNRANIYFDRNPAVVTAYVHSPIADNLALANRAQQPTGLGILLYPNPSKGSCLVRVSGAAGKDRSVTVSTLQGTVLLQSPLSPEGSLRLEGLAPGIYLVRVEGYKPERLIIVR